MKNFDTRFTETLKNQEFVIKHESPALHETLFSPSVYSNTTDMFRTALVIAIGKLNSLLESNLVYSEEDNSLSLRYDEFEGFDVFADDSEDCGFGWYALSQTYDLPSHSNLQVIADGLNTLYKYLADFTIVSEYGEFSLNGRKVACSNVQGNPAELFRKYASAMSEKLKASSNWLLTSLKY